MPSVQRPVEPRTVERSLEQRAQHAEALFEGIDDEVFVHDLEGHILDANPAACRRLGYTRDELLRMTTRDIDDPAFATGFEERLQQQLTQGQLSCEGCHITKDGRRIPVDINTSIIEIDGQPAVLAVMRDISQQKRMQALLLQSDKLASIGLLSAGVAHEINNPLAYVANNLVVLERDMKGLRDLLNVYEEGYPALAQANPGLARRAEQLAEEIDLPYIRDNLDRILKRTREGVERITKIVHGLRSLARTDRPELEQVNLSDLVEASLDMVRGRLHRRSIELDLRLEPLPAVRCVASQIGQVLLNLLVNAVQAIETQPESSPGKIELTVRRAGPEVTIEVADNGCGIEPSALPHIFDPFYTSKPVGEGTGLGLSISHGIVAGHGGRIEVESQPGTGARFRVFLPIDSHRGTA
jgi:PAS domain S-box-containing protein